MKENNQNLIVRLASWVTLVVALLFVAQTGQSQVVFDNTRDSTTTADPYLNPGTVYFSDVNEFGDDVTITNATGCVLTNFAIQVFATTNLTSAKMRLKIYANDGTNYGVLGGTNLNYAYYTPKTLLYDSGSMTLTGGKNTQFTNGTTHTFTFDRAAANGNFIVYVPTNFTWTVSFSNLNSGASMGLVQYDATNSPLTGTDYIGFWENTGGAWVYRESTNGVAINFGMIATKAVIAAGAAPALTITKPTAAFKIYTAALAVNGTAKAASTGTNDANNRIALVSVRVGSTPAAAWSSTPIYLPVAWGGTLAGAQTWAGTIPNVGPAGAVTTIFTAVDAALVSISKTNSGTFVVTNEPLTVVINTDQGTENATVKLSSTPVASLVAGTTNIAGLQIDKAYKLSITEPLNAGYFLSDVANSVSGTVSNRQNSIFKLPYAYNFIMKSNLTITVNFVTNRFYAVEGTYNGLFAVGSTPTLSNAGWVTLTLKGKTRAFTGKVNVDGDSGLGFKGTFGLDGTASGIIDRTKKGKANLGFTLALPFNGSDTVTGTITNNSWSASLLADRQLPSSDFNARYSMVIPGNDTTTTTLTPGGDTVASVLITNTLTVSNKVTINGYFGDDIAKLVTQTTYASKSGRIGMFAPGYKFGTNTFGFVWGWLVAATNVAPALSDVGGVTWVKTPSTNTIYSSGFTFLNESIVTSPYNAPTGTAGSYSGAVIGLDASFGGGTNTPPLSTNTYGVLLYGGADIGTETTIGNNGKGLYEDTLKAKLNVNKGETTSGVTLTESIKDGFVTVAVTPLAGLKHSGKTIALQNQNLARGAFNGVGGGTGQSGYIIIK